MYTAVLVVFYIVCTILIVTILLQAGKGADIGAAFGGASNTVFGGRGPATFLNKLTAVIAVLFLALSIWLAQMTGKTKHESVVDKVPVNELAAPAPAAPVEK